MTEKNLTIHQDESRPLRSEKAGHGTLRPAVDIFENNEAWTFMADMPGVGKSGLDLNIDQGILSIRGRVEGGAKGETLYREFRTGEYLRQFQLPGDVDVEKADASLKNGVLTLVLPKTEAAKPRRIEITIH